MATKKQKQSPFLTDVPEPAKPARATQMKGQTYRLNLDAWLQLKRLAAEQGLSQQALLDEALNDYFEKHGLERLA